MGRSKKTRDEMENLEPELEEAMEAEGLEAAEDDAEESEVLDLSDDSDDEEEVVEKKKPARKPRARKPRAKKAEPASLLGAMSEPVEEKAAEEKAPEVKVAASEETEEAPEKPARVSRKAAKEEKEEAETIGKPWVAVKEISTSISSNLERVNQMLREIPQQELFRPPVAKPAAITKVAVGMSFFAIVLSLVSLLLSQSARQVALDRFTPPTQAVVHAAPTAPSEPKQLAFEANLPKRKPQRASRKAAH